MATALAESHTGTAQGAFIFFDLETTGLSPHGDRIIEIAGLRVAAGGRIAGRFHQLIRIDVPVPPFITSITGITDDMVRGAPALPGVLPAFVEFVHGAVIVGHNVSFDLAFLNAALEDNERLPLDNLIVDTLALARRLAHEEIPNCRLGTLAAALELEHRPAHRALDDVMATADLLHRLIEDATGFGVFQLGQLVELPQFIPTIARTPSRKLRAFL